MKNKFINDIELLNQKKYEINFKAGDIICVNFSITEKGFKNKTQNFEGIVLSIKNNGISSTCTLRKSSFGEGVEKTFFINNPNVNWIKIKKQGFFRKSKIYYARNLKKRVLKI